MSYDVFFCMREGASTPSPEAIAEFFRRRPNYTVHDTEAVYRNDDTNVYFSFNYSPQGPLEKSEEGVSHPASFNINYNRPSFFALEAAPELEAFAAAFGFVVDDPQLHGMGENSDFSADGFLKGFEAGNLFGVKVMLKHGTPVPGPSSLPRQQLHAIWRWNYGRKHLQAVVGDNLFVPRIMPLFQAGTILTTAVWGDLVPSVLPRVDVVLAPLDQFKGLLGKKGAIHILPFEGLSPLLPDFVVGSDPLTHWHLEYSRPPRSLLKHVRRSSKSKGKLSLVSWDMVIDKELLDSARKKT